MAAGALRELQPALGARKLDADWVILPACNTASGA
jgi:hypothetical protein